MEAKRVYGHFMQQRSNISNEKTWTRIRKEILKRETEFLLIEEQNNTQKDQLYQNMNRQAQ